MHKKIIRNYHILVKVDVMMQIIILIIFYIDFFNLAHPGILVAINSTTYLPLTDFYAQLSVIMK